MARVIWETHCERQQAVDHKLNRNVRRLQVKRYIHDRTSNNWTISHQGIAFGLDGSLRDGQHRILSTIDSGETWVHVLVTVDLPDEAIPNIDALPGRSDIDHQHCAGRWPEARNTHVSTVKFMDSATGKNPVGARKWTSAELDRAFRRHWDALQFAIGATGNRTKKGITIGPVLAAIAKAYYYFKDGQLPRLERFVRVIMSGLSDDPTEHAAAALHNWLIQQTSGNGTERWWAHLRTQLAISAFMAGQPRQYIRLPKEELYPITEEHTRQ